MVPASNFTKEKKQAALQHKILGHFGADVDWTPRNPPFEEFQFLVEKARKTHFLLNHQIQKRLGLAAKKNRNHWKQPVGLRTRNKTTCK